MACGKSLSVLTIARFFLGVIFIMNKCSLLVGLIGFRTGVGAYE